LTPLVSIIIPVFNPNLNFFKQCLDSIMNQSYKNLEIIIILEQSNDSKLDEEAKKLVDNYNDPRTVFISKDHVGAAHARNLGMSKAKGELIALMDSDDVCDANRIEKQVDFFHNHEADIVGTFAKIIDENNNELGTFRFPLDPKTIRRSIMVSIPFVNASTMFKKEIVDKGGGYNESFPTAEDYEFFIRQIARGAKGYNIDEPLYSNREHSQSLNRKAGRKFGNYYIRAKLSGISLGIRSPRDLFYFIITLPAFFFSRKTSLFAYRTVGRFFSRSIE